MATIEGPVKINQVVLLELRLMLGGPQPSLLARFALMDSAGLTYAETRLESVSKRSMGYLEALRKSLEQDMVELITEHPGETMSPEEEADAEGKGNEFSALNDEADGLGGEAGLDDDGISFR